MRFGVSTLSALTLATLAVGPRLDAAAVYNVTNIGLLGTGTTSTGFAVNNTGVAAGQSAITPSPIMTNGFVYTPSNSTLTGIPTFQATGGNGSSSAYGVNDAGVMVGTAATDQSANGLAGRQDAFTYSGGVLRDIGTLGGLTTTGYAINATGTVVGTGGLTGSGQHGFSYNVNTGTPGTLTDLGSARGAAFSSDARAVNASGVIAGGSVFDSTNQIIAATYSSGTWNKIGALPSSTLASIAFGINADGEVVGRSFVSAGGFHNHAFAYTTVTGLVDLGNLGAADGDTVAYGVNDLGQIVGVSRAIVAGNSVNHAFIATLSPNGTVSMTDLNSLIDPASGWVLSTAYGISNAGFITGVGTFNGMNRAFELSLVPEPTSLAAVLVGGSLLKRRRRF